MAKLKKSESKSNGKAAKKATPKPATSKAAPKSVAKKSASKRAAEPAHLTHALTTKLLVEIAGRMGADATLVDLHKGLEDELMRVQDAMGEVEELMETHGEDCPLERLAH
jgi:hypothetical protein